MLFVRCNGAVQYLERYSSLFPNKIGALVHSNDCWYKEHTVISLIKWIVVIDMVWLW